MSLPPCLVITSLEILGERVAADLQIGPRRERLVLDLSMIDVIYGYVEMPRALDLLQRPKRAVIDLLVRAYRGDRPNLPMDLSNMTRESAEPWPAFSIPRGETLKPSFEAHASQVEHDAPERGLEMVHLSILNVPTRVIVDNRERRKQPRFPTLFRFAEGVHPLQLDDAGSLAMFLAIDKAIAGGVSF